MHIPYFPIFFFKGGGNNNLIHNNLCLNYYSCLL